MQNLSKIDTAKDLVTKEWVEAQDFLPSSAFTKTGIKNALGIADWALAASKPSYNFSEIGSKPTTLDGYGITDAVISRLEIEPYESGVGNRMGYSYSSKGWNVNGPAMVWGLPYLNVRLNADTGSGDNPGLYLSIYNNGTAYQWAQVVTDKNFTQFGVKAGRRYTGAYDDDPKSANDINYPSMSGFTSHLANVPFNNGNLLTITTNPNLYVGQIAMSSLGDLSFRTRNETTWTDWKTILHIGNIGDYAMSKAGGTIDGNLTINGQFKAQTSLASVSLLSNIFDVNASLKVQPGWNLYLNGEAIMKWSDLKSKITYSFSEIGSKPTTLDGYGITDSVYRNNNFNATSSKPWVLGYSNASYGWKATGPAMLFGTGSYYARLNIAQMATDNPAIYVSLVNAGTEYGWAQVVTDKSFTEFGVKAGRRYTGAYDDDPKSANDINYPSMSGFTSHLANVPFNNGNLLAITTNPNLYVGQLAISSDGKIAFRSRNETTWTNWRTILHSDNIGTTSLPSLNLNGETITSWGQVRTSWGMQVSTAASGNNSYSVDTGVIFKINTTLTSAHTVNIALSANAPSQQVVIFTVGSSKPTITITKGSTTIKWENGTNPLSSLQTGKTYRIQFDSNLAMTSIF